MFTTSHFMLPSEVGGNGKGNNNKEQGAGMKNK